jgi:hypothetical protein
MVAKWLQMLKELSPRISLVAFMFNPSSFPGGEAVYRIPFEAAASSFGIEPRMALVRTPPMWRPHYSLSLVSLPAA